MVLKCNNLWYYHYSEIDISNERNDEESKDGLSALSAMFPKPQIEKSKKRGR